MLGTSEIILILCVTLLLFGGKKLPEFAKNLGKGIREFKKASQGLDEDVEIQPTLVKQENADEKK